ncbi:MAG: hypothetical protein B7X04_01670 [Parcubacteria group bacterium 21-54-25]|nr:MAG: hypothetical protein B7X04_01670 [Parcubacteria group bacterium 21-54-25]HQU07633.1 HemK/PrmC family methyltransferase [Candidatus Paceibacterota bacterium]
MDIFSDGVSQKDAAWLLRDKYNGETSTGYEADLKRLAGGEPLAYVIGWVPFLGLRIYLESHPLIPRPETEWWTGQLIKMLQEKYADQPVCVLDLCAGSGAIGCAVLAHCPHTQVTFAEIDPAHENTIRTTMRMNNLDSARADIYCGDLFAPVGKAQFDIIATNPPYVPDGRALPPEVARFEPTRALRAGADGLAYIRRIAQQARAHLTIEGSIWVEIDDAQAPEALALFARNGWNAKLRTDPYGRRRLIVAY